MSETKPDRAAKAAALECVDAYFSGGAKGNPHWVKEYADITSRHYAPLVKAAEQVAKASVIRTEGACTDLSNLVPGDIYKLRVALDSVRGNK